jgi:hypothetical protein
MAPKTQRIFGPPGTGKTTALLEVVERHLREGVPPQEIGFMAFTRAAAREAKSRALQVFPWLDNEDLRWFRTIHSACYALLGLGRGSVATGPKLKDFALKFGYEISPPAERDPEDFEVQEMMLRTLGDYLLFFEDWRRNLMLWDIAEAYNRFLEPADWPDGWSPPQVTEFHHRYRQWKADNGLADFADMLMLVLRDRLAPTVSVLIVDECLPYHTPVLLADGTSLPIGEIVEKRLPAQVLSYNPVTEIQEPKPVLAYHKLTLRKPLVKVSARWRKGKQKIYSFVVCTEDHLVFTPAGYKAAAQLTPGDCVQVETSARRSQKYKITAPGRSALSKCMRQKDADPWFDHYAGGGALPVQGGNGKGLTEPQRALLKALGAGWVSEYILPLGQRRLGYPTHYKIDIAHPFRHLAVEVDGESHKMRTRRTEDRKKEEVLASLGWTVYRVSNLEALRRADEIAAQLNGDCPKWAIVTNVEPVTIPEAFVYDLTVADNHNFYANGILVHNCQDLSPLQAEVIRLWASGARLLYLAGDPDQAIYTFNGADPSIFLNWPHDEDRQLTQSHRVPRAVHEIALRLIRRNRERVDVPYKPQQGEGYVRFGYLNSLPIETLAQEGNVLLLARNRYLLSDFTDSLVARGLAFEALRGSSPLRTGVTQAILAGHRLVRGERVSMADAARFIEALPSDRYLARGAKAQVAELAKQCPEAEVALRDMGTHFKPAFWDLLVNHNANFIEALRLPPLQRAYYKKLLERGGEQALLDAPRIKVGTIHSAKGMEADFVVLRPEMAGRTYAEWLKAPEGERRCWYVGLTRARKGLWLLEPDGMRAIDWRLEL